MSRSRIAATGAALVSVLAFAACTPASQTAEEELQQVTVAVNPVITHAPLYLGKEQGFFAEEGIDLTLEIIQTGAAGVAGITSGEYEFGGSAVSPIISAISQGVPVKIVATAASTRLPQNPTDPYGDAVVLVTQDSPITQLSDLEGAVVGVNALQAGLELVVRGAVDRSGGDSDAVEFLPIPFPDMVAALEAGQAEAIAPVEPFVTAAINAGHRVVSSTFPYGPEGASEFISATYYTSTQLEADDPDLIARFRRATERSNAYAQENPDQVREVVPGYTGLDESMAARISLPDYPDTLDTEAYLAEADLMARYSFIPAPPGSGELFVAE